MAAFRIYVTGQDKMMVSYVMQSMSGLMDSYEDLYAKKVKQAISLAEEINRPAVVG